MEKSKSTLNGIIKNITINFRKLQNETIPLGRKLTLISGHNGTMKSTILGLIIQPFSNSSNSSANINKNKMVGIDGEFLEGKFSKNITFAFPEYDQINCLSAQLELYDNIYIQKFYTYKSVYRSDNDTLRIYADTREPGAGYIYGIPVGALYLDRLFPVSTIIDNELQRRSSDTKTKKQLHDNMKLTDVQTNQYLKWYQQIFPFGEEVDFISPMKFNEKVLVNTKFKKRDYRSMSSGEDVLGRILIILLSLMEAKKKLGDDYKGALLTIDELECSFHPPAAKKLLSLLVKFASENNVQIIATTHSIDLIEEISILREQTQKNVKTKDDFNVIYLKNDDHKISIENNPAFLSIKNHLLLKSERQPKIPILVEDEEAKILAEAFLEKKYLDKVQIISTQVGCKELLALNKKKVFKEISRSIILLDGDNKKDAKTQHEKNVFTLPDTINPENNPNNPENNPNNPENNPNNPENYVATFLRNLDSTHDFWKAVPNCGYTKNHFQNRIDFSKMGDREYAKKWFNKEKEFWETSCNLFSLIKEMCKDEIQSFNEDFIECYNNVCGKYLLPEIKDLVNEKTPKTPIENISAQKVDITEIKKTKDAIHKAKSKKDTRILINEYFYLLTRNLEPGSRFTLQELDKDIFDQVQFTGRRYEIKHKTNSFRFYCYNKHQDTIRHIGKGYFEVIR